MTEQIIEKLQNAIRELVNEDVDVALTRPEPAFGDYTTNIALQLSKKVGRSPRDIAEELAETLRATPEVLEASVAGPGFINIRLSDEALIATMNSLIVRKETSSSAVIETNNPNPFKAMHIGHAFNAILADTIANLLDSQGITTHRVSYHGDVGAHVGRSMYSLLGYINGNINKLIAVPENERNSFMSRMYAEGAAVYKEDETARAKIDELTKQSFVLDDPLYKQVYDTCKSWSFQQIDQIIMRLGNKPIEKRYLESEADTLGVETVRAHVPDVFSESDGAVVFKGSQHGSFDNVFVSSGGRGLYGARDLGLMQLKNHDYPDATKSYIVTAEEQRDYFKGVIKAAELCLPQLIGVTENISTGTVKLSTGKMSSRSGDVLEIGWLFEQIGEAIKSRGGTPDDSLIAGALRYQFLKVRVGSDVVFDVAEAVSLQGNSGPYLQYAYARARSILRKSTVLPTPLHDLTDGEHQLVRKLSQCSEVIEHAGLELLPHVVCTYLYELAQEFNRFYEKNRVIDDPREALRLTLVKAYAGTLKSGLAVLGVTAPEQM